DYYCQSSDISLTTVLF
nr:immunoglobulin light chain junction region [Macaca mulatta]MOX69276.1 immunoglobulin light chain junction region [Macaca mulatta]MOX70127.1 immunoglobulin light chain junction region [Macaca mulatta]MOX70221.1 immunoglobulin light chain junction region [Macaca mulatta]MOX71060.1 immunoglobulin light chain junction region [Macaca mulatta]